MSKTNIFLYPNVSNANRHNHNPFSKSRVQKLKFGAGLDWANNRKTKAQNKINRSKNSAQTQTNPTDQFPYLSAV